MTAMSMQVMQIVYVVHKHSLRLALHAQVVYGIFVSALECRDIEMVYKSNGTQDC